MTRDPDPWAQCGGASYCGKMLDKPSQELVDLLDRWESIDFKNDNSWLQARLENFSGPPGMKLGVVDDPSDPLDYYAVVLTIPMPNSHNPREVFPVGRIMFSYAAAMQDEDLLKEEVFELANALALHEVREWFRFNGKHIHEPHPPEGEPVRRPGAHKAKPKNKLREILHV